MRWTVSSVLAGVLLLAACGSDSSAVELTGRADSSGGEFAPQVVSAGDVSEMRVVCGSLELEDRTIDLSRYPVFEGSLADWIPGGFREEFDLQWEEGLKDVQLHEIENTDDRLRLFGSSGTSPDGFVGFREIAFRRGGGVWQLETWGGCTPQVVADGWGITELALRPETEPTAASTTLTVWVTERSCANGDFPHGRKIAPVVTQSAEMIDLLVMLELPDGDVSCPGNPSFPITVELDAPLGDRSIRNVAFEPSVELEWPVPLRDAEIRISVVGDAPAGGRANALFVEHDQPIEGFLLDAAGWRQFRGEFMGLTAADSAIVIRGFVTECGPSESCFHGVCAQPGGPAAEELAAEGIESCEAFTPVAASCDAAVTAEPGRDAEVTVAYLGDSCAIAVEQVPIR